MDGLVGTKFFGVIKRFIKIETYQREGGGARNPRHRIELQSWMPTEIVLQALEFVMPCVACGAPVHPFRQRGGNTGHVYYAPCCPLTVNIGCSRGRAASDEYNRVVAAVEPRKAQGDLFP